MMEFFGDKQIPDTSIQINPTKLSKDKSKLIIQLIAGGAADLYLTGNPQITYFKEEYKRHTKFAKGMVTIKSNKTRNVEWGQKMTFELCDKYTDLYGEMYLCFSMDGEKLDQIKWKQYLAYRLIHQIEFSIGGQRIDRMFGWMLLYDEMMHEKEPFFETYHGEKYLVVPIRFYWNTNSGSYLPNIALYEHRIQVDVVLADFVDVCEEMPANIQKPKLQCLLKVNGIMLDSDERRRFAQVSHEYKAIQHQYTGPEMLPEGIQTHIIRLNFNHSVKQLFFTLHESNDLFTCGYANTNDDPLVSAKLMFNGHLRWEHDPIYLRTIDKRQSGQYTPKVPVYSYNFGLNSSVKPSGQANFSRIDNATLYVTVKPGVTGITIWCKNFNVLRVMRGMAGLVYSM